MIKRLAQWIDTVPTQLRLDRVQRGFASQTRKDIRFIDVGDAIIRFRQSGKSGPSLVLATDPPVPLECYDQLMAAFGSHFRVTVFELPGFGCSLPRARFLFSLASATAAVQRFLEQLPHAPHVLAMPCVTAYSAVLIANARPDLIAQLVFLQTPSWSDGQTWLRSRDPASVLRTPVVGQLALAALKRRRVRQWYTAALGDANRLDAFCESTLANFDHGGCFCLASGFQNFLSESQPDLRPVRQDSLVIWGQADRSHRHSDPSGIASLAPNHRLVCLDGVGHFPELEAPENVLDQLLSFVPRSSA